MYFLSAIIGLAAGISVWLTGLTGSRFRSRGPKAENPALVGSRRLRIGEAVACGALFFACLALAFWIALALG